MFTQGFKILSDIFSLFLRAVFTWVLIPLYKMLQNLFQELSACLTWLLKTNTRAVKRRQKMENMRTVRRHAGEYMLWCVCIIWLTVIDSMNKSSLSYYEPVYSFLEKHDWNL